MTASHPNAQNAGAGADLNALIQNIGAAARSAAFVLAQCDDAQITACLKNCAARIRAHIETILAANTADVDAAKAKGLTPAMIDRLILTPARIESIAAGIEVVASLPDPTGRILWQETRPNGLKIERVSVPIGVLGMIYESRPNVTVDAAALCLKSKNAVILRGGSESLQSSLALHRIVQDALLESGLPEAAVSMIPTADRAAVGLMLAMNEYIDVMIPRGGKTLIERVMNEARMPVFGHLEGLCHIYVDAGVKPDIALSVPLNAKMRRTGVCGAMETLLLDSSLDNTLAKQILAGLLDAGCAIVGDKAVQALDSRIGPASEDDWRTEYLEARLSCRIVDGVDEAITHINHYGSHHTDSILTEDADKAARFLARVDSGIVLHNASTQFADGGEFGMGAEIGIGTGKLHARGPVGLEQLCTYKYIVRGNGQIRPV